MAQVCECTEMLYLNERTNGGAVHKYSIDPANGDLTEIGSPWFDNAAAGEDLIDPHGNTTDLNGNVYVGERLDLDIRKFNCDGTLSPKSEFVIPNQAGFNFASVGNTLYTNGGGKIIIAFDLCTGDSINSVCLDQARNNEDWGFYYDERTATFYSTGIAFGSNNDGAFNGDIWAYTASDFETGTCVSPFISTDDGVVNPGDVELPYGNLRGITTDLMGNIYVVFSDRYALLSPTPRSAKLVKFSPTGQFISEIPWDSVDGDGGYFFGQAIVYSETSNSLYVATGSTIEDCVAHFDLDLNYLGVAVPPVATGDAEAKGMSIVVECCPTEPVQVITDAICNATLPYNAFVNEVYPCTAGVSCEAPWEFDAANSDAVANFNDCSQSIELTSFGCATFTQASDGAGLKQCGAFNITFEICVYEGDLAPPVISFLDNTCNPDVAGSVSINTPCEDGSVIEFSVDGGASWSTTVPTYDFVLPVTMRARCVSETCGASPESADVTSAPQECCPPVNCVEDYGGIAVIKNEP